MELLENQATTDFDGVKLSLASPERILKWSHGEVTKPETINYRTQKPEKDGLFCEKIFGPTKDWECYCGKYKRIRYKDVVCDKCGVRVTRSIVRRERMGHISLAVPVTHIWFLRGTPSSTGLVLNMSIRDLERVVYFASYIVTHVDDQKREKALADLEVEFNARRNELIKAYEKRAGELDADVKALAEAQNAELDELDASRANAKAELEGLNRLTLLPEAKYRDLNLKFGEVFRAEIGAEAIRNLLAEIDMDKLVEDLTAEAEASQGQKRKKTLKRLKMIEGMKAAGIRPEWMVMTELPVIPPDLRPMVQLAGGRFAASDLNDLYRRVINRNNRLKRLIELDAPEVIRRNEKRMLQEAVDALIDNNARRERAVSSTGTRRKLKSLSDMLKGKQGRFRQNLLGKRVDYSGRSVIVAGPVLHLYQCGLPKMMALELFKPFVIGSLIEQELAHNVKSASRMIERATNVVWDTLEEIIADKYVLLNRAPTLHRLGIQAFKPILIEGKAIQLHPLVCRAFNADFDGDQMAVHVPLSGAAQREAREIMLSTKNLLKPADGEVVVDASKDMVLGNYYLTFQKFGEDKAAKAYASTNEAIYAYDTGNIKLQTLIKVPIEGQLIETTVGRILFNEILPEGFGFRNQAMTKKALQRLMAEVFVRYGTEVTAETIDQVKNLGFKHSTLAAVSVSLDDYIIPADKNEILEAGEKQAASISSQYAQGLITDEERYQRTVDTWKQSNDRITQSMASTLKTSDTSTAIFIESGAEGDTAQANQIAGMLGLVVDPSGRTIELPIKSNYKEGFSVLEYFNSTHGARKGLTDTALKTAESGYLTRRLVDVSQDVIVTEEDCGDTDGRLIERSESNSIGESFAARIAGRVAAKAVKSDKTTLVKAGELITDEIAKALDAAEVNEIAIRSVLSCKTSWGICRLCYGIDLARGTVVELGEPIGVIAAQSIGEPGTQLTMKTFHKGGVAGDDITQGLPRVEEIFEARSPKGQAVLAELDGVVTVKHHQGKTSIRISPADLKVTTHELDGRKASVKTGDKVIPGDVLAADENGKKAIKAKVEGTVKVHKDRIELSHTGGAEREYTVPAYQNVEVQSGDLVTVGQRLTEGSINLQEMLTLLGEAAVQNYIIAEVQTIYAAQGQIVSDKHIEVIIRQMFSRVQVEEPGDSLFVTGEIVPRQSVIEENEALEAEGKTGATFTQLLLPVTKISLSADSFLSAASFQDTTRVLIAAAVRGKTDKLRGLKENVIIGRLIPVGTGFRTAAEIEQDAAATAQRRADENAQVDESDKTE
ncbi:MAG TPA: DNA-directed RNA polymerase subunit beta' [Candidatus Saccharimonadia bacterium]|nr:DNA-directed RNA polymerase subunit beta' [Candidatus Saccharimonadia bacterium]